MDSISIRVTNPHGMPLPGLRGIAKHGTTAEISEARGENVKHYRRVARAFGIVIDEEMQEPFESVGDTQLSRSADFQTNGLPRDWRALMNKGKPEPKPEPVKKSPLDRMANLLKAKKK